MADDPFYEDFSEAPTDPPTGFTATTEDWILNVTPKFSASISIPCSVFIIYEVISDHRSGKGTAMLRALMGMSSVDIMASFAWWLSLWAVPSDTGALATGNVASCNFQGFLLQLAIGAPLYNCSLALYYLLVIKYSWSNDHLRKIERYVHASIITFAISSAIAGLPLKMYNRFSYVCWSFGNPVDCGNSGTTPTDIPCERGDWAWLFGVVLFFVPLWTCIILTIVAMTLIYFHVRATMRRMRMYAFGRAQRGSQANTRDSGSQGDEQKAKKKLSLSGFRASVRASMRASLNGLRNSQNGESTTAQAQRRADQLSIFASQAVLYSLSFFLTWTPSTVWSIGRWFHMADFWLDFASSLCEPLQGFWNLLIFLRQRPQSKKKIRRFWSKICCCLKERLLEGIGERSEVLRSSAAPNTDDSIRCNIDRMSVQHYNNIRQGSGSRLTANVTSTDLSAMPPISAFGEDDSVQPFSKSSAFNSENFEVPKKYPDDKIGSPKPVVQESPEQPPVKKLIENLSTPLDLAEKQDGDDEKKPVSNSNQNQSASEKQGGDDDKNPVSDSNENQNASEDQGGDGDKNPVSNSNQNPNPSESLETTENNVAPINSDGVIDETKDVDKAKQLEADTDKETPAAPVDENNDAIDDSNENKIEEERQGDPDQGDDSEKDESIPVDDSNRLS